MCLPRFTCKNYENDPGTSVKRCEASSTRKALIGVKTIAQSQPEGKVDKHLFSFNSLGVSISSISNKGNALHF